MTAEMAGRRIDGKAAALALRQRVAASVAEFREKAGRAPGLATVLVGEDPASAVYVRSKGNATAEAGMVSFAHNLADTTSEAELLDLVAQLNADERVDGILVQLPLPAQIDSTRVIAAIDPAKDVDGFHPINVGRLSAGLDALVPCTPLGCLHLLKAELGSLAGLDAVVIGRSNIVGKPMAALLIAESATVTVAHSKSRDLPDIVRRADIVVAAVGRPRWSAATGSSRARRSSTSASTAFRRDGGKSRLVGDVAFDEAVAVAGGDHSGPGRRWADDHRHADAQHAGRRAPPRRPG